MGREPPRAPRPRSGGETPGSGDTPTQILRPGALSGPIKGATIAKKYRLDKLIAIGGMGSVWRGHDTLLERDVAIKFMDPAIAGNEVLRRRFNREAKSAARLRTPHVVQIIEFGVDGDVPFIVMELLEGEDLQTRLKRERRIHKSELIPITKQIGKALRSAHESGVVHRDLKPQNVFLAQQDDEMVVKVLDFGVAKMTDAVGEGTKAGVVVGSPHYMSPEQARGLPSLDGRSDLWSLAVILFKAITGHRPFKGDVAGDIIVKICAEPIPLASSMRKSLGPAVDAFFTKALERDPDQRFQQAVEMTDAFARALYADRAAPAEILSEEATQPAESEPPPSMEHTGHAGGTAPMGTASVPGAIPPAATSASGAEGIVSGAENSDRGAEISSVSGVDPSFSGAEVTTGPSFPTPGGTIPGGTATPATGASMATGFAGSLPPSAEISDPVLIPRDSPSKAVIGGVAAGALLFIIIVVMAMSSEPESESGQANQPPTTPVGSQVTETPWGPVVVPGGTEPSASVSQSPESGGNLPEPIEQPSATPDPSAETAPEPSAAPSASTIKRRRRPARRRRRNEDWGY
jgi:serine/threonine protein kinase